MENLNWDDLRLFLLVARTRSLSGAAVQLGVSPSTVGRRVVQLEQALGVSLFVRHASGYRLTEDGGALLDEARRVEDAVVQLRGHAADMSATPRGHVRLATNDALANLLILPRWAELAPRYPDLVLELLTGSAVQDLYRRDADLALRLVRPEAGGLVVRKLGIQAYAVYARKGLVPTAAKRSQAALANLPWIGWDVSVQHLVQARWQREHFPQAAIALTANSIFTQLHAAEQGLGLAVLPCYIADASALLERCLAPSRCVSQDIWLVIQQGLRDSPRVRLIADLLTELVHDNGDAIAGRR
ncbi:LysR family transcriptional regulator [Thiomonas intermedia]|uniref:LysR family transcriptional regulator n=1 Tax=Thiomonas intermedia TaxID=926 RepID=UPI001475A174|nr:LysR family transcriptional regulator [Thiomonas intermedia]